MEILYLLLLLHFIKMFSCSHETVFQMYRYSSVSQSVMIYFSCNCVSPNVTYKVTWTVKFNWKSLVMFGQRRRGNVFSQGTKDNLYENHSFISIINLEIIPELCPSRNTTNLLDTIQCKHLQMTIVLCWTFRSTAIMATRLVALHMTSQTTDSKKTPVNWLEVTVVAHTCCRPAAVFPGGVGETAPGGGSGVGERPEGASWTDGQSPSAGACNQAGGGASHTGQGC